MSYYPTNNPYLSQTFSSRRKMKEANEMYINLSNLLNVYILFHIAVFMYTKQYGYADSSFANYQKWVMEKGNFVLLLCLLVIILLHCFTQTTAK